MDKATWAFGETVIVVLIAAWVGYSVTEGGMAASALVLLSSILFQLVVIRGKMK